MPWGGAKVTNHLAAALARDEARRAGADEALICDREGYLVEGSRCCIVVVDRSGRATTPDPARGGVAGLAREIALERVPELRIANVPRHTLSAASELIALNAIRGARPILHLDGAPVGNATPGPLAKHLAKALANE